MPSITVQVAGGNRLQLDLPSDHLQVIALCWTSLLASEFHLRTLCD